MKSYSTFTTNIQRCWAHILRGVKYVADKEPEAEGLCEGLHRLYNRLVDAMAKVKTVMKHMLTFILNPGVEPTNNRAERALREHVVIRKIIGTLRNEKGTKIHETAMNCLVTWRQRDLNPYNEICYTGVLNTSLFSIVHLFVGPA